MIIYKKTSLKQYSSIIIDKKQNEMKKLNNTTKLYINVTT